MADVVPDDIRGETIHLFVAKRIRLKTVVSCLLSKFTGTWSLNKNDRCATRAPMEQMILSQVVDC